MRGGTGEEMGNRGYQIPPLIQSNRARVQVWKLMLDRQARGTPTEVIGGKPVQGSKTGTGASREKLIL